jgi:L-fuconolactonase
MRAPRSLGDDRPVIIDTHTHVACADRDRFPIDATGVASDWWREGGTIDDLLAVQDATGVDHVVVVQAVGAYGYDNSCAIASVAAHRERASFVCAVDMNGTDPARALVELLDDPRTVVPVRGVRLFGVGNISAQWLDDGRVDAVFAVAATRGLTIVPTILADRFDTLAPLAIAHPDVPIAIDHCGFLDMVDGDGEAMVMELVSIPSVNLKVTSYVLEAAITADGDAAPLVERLGIAFGADRLCWGSDHPQDLRHDYADKVALARSAIRSFDARATDDFFAHTGSRLFA